ncbi:MAG: Ig-like domain-containing protein [Candidatus Symbiothrix sp.]|nr:Ig-like domain-containing protein [Candidatus Symbiothrix sp.]
MKTRNLVRGLHISTMHMTSIKSAKIMLLAAVLVTANWSLVTASAQVKIGGDPSTGPASGAVLDLSSSTNGGLLLPQVTLTNATALPTEWIGTVADVDLLESGLMVYNIGGGSLDAGVYIWQGTLGWAPAGSGINPDVPQPESIAITADPAGDIFVGDTQTLTATVSPANAGWTTVNWGGNNTGIATIESTGINTATVTGVAPGNTPVVASLDGIDSAPFGITVNPILATGVTITGGNYAAPADGGTISRSAAITNASTVSNKNVNWTSNDAAVTIDPTTTPSGGNVTIAVASGTSAVAATVTATAADASGQYATIAVTRVSATCEGLVVPNSRTGFLSGAYSSVPTTIPTGRLCVYKQDGTSRSWPAQNAYVAAGTGYENNDASLFEGVAASCEAGFRLPTIVEFKTIATYFTANFGGATAPNGNKTYSGWNPLLACCGRWYWTSTYTEPNNASSGYAWYEDFNGNGQIRLATSSSILIRCVRDF